MNSLGKNRQASAELGGREEPVLEYPPNYAEAETWSQDTKPQRKARQGLNSEGPTRQNDRFCLLLLITLQMRKFPSLVAARILKQNKKYTWPALHKEGS